MSNAVASALRRLLAHRSARWALTVIVALAVAAIVGPLLVSNSCFEQLDIVAMKNRPPSLAHPFGTDQYSRDVFARVLCGTRLSLTVASLAVALSITIGTAFGLISGFAGGRVDGVMMRVLDAFLSIPRVLLVIAAVTIWHPLPLWGLIVLLGTTGWFGVSRLVRAETLSVKREDYVDAARALGAPASRIVWRHVLPNVASPVIVTATLAVGNVIALEAGLSYLGAGAREPNASLGAIVLDGINFFAGNWWVAFFPGVVIVAIVMAFNVLGDALRDVLDPRQLHGHVTAAPLERVGPLMSNVRPEPLENG